MFFRRKHFDKVTDIDNIAWLQRDGNDKRQMTQWMDEDFYRLWLQNMEWAFDLLGMMDQYKRFVEELREGADLDLEAPAGMVPVRGWWNRRSVRKAMENLEKAFPTFELTPVKDGQVLRYKGEKSKALELWGAVTDLLGKATVIGLVTPGLQYYVKGTQVGYSPRTRHLFRRGNTVERGARAFGPGMHTLGRGGEEGELDLDRMDVGRHRLFCVSHAARQRGEDPSGGRAAGDVAGSKDTGAVCGRAGARRIPPGSCGGFPQHSARPVEEPSRGARQEQDRCGDVPLRDAQRPSCPFAGEARVCGCSESLRRIDGLAGEPRAVNGHWRGRPERRFSFVRRGV